MKKLTPLVALIAISFMAFAAPAFAGGTFEDSQTLTIAQQMTVPGAKIDGGGTTDQTPGIVQISGTCQPPATTAGVETLKPATMTEEHAVVQTDIMTMQTEIAGQYGGLILKTPFYGDSSVTTIS